MKEWYSVGKAKVHVDFLRGVESIGIETSGNTDNPSEPDEEYPYILFMSKSLGDGLNSKQMTRTFFFKSKSTARNRMYFLQKIINKLRR